MSQIKERFFVLCIKRFLKITVQNVILQKPNSKLYLGGSVDIISLIFISRLQFMRSDSAEEATNCKSVLIFS